MEKGSANLQCLFILSFAPLTANVWSRINIKSKFENVLENDDASPLKNSSSNIINLFNFCCNYNYSHILCESLTLGTSTS